MGLHAIGDRANDEAAELFKDLRANVVAAAQGAALARHRVEHVQHVSGPDSLAAMREAGIVAVTNPLHLVPDLDVIQAALGQQRSRPDLAFPSAALLQVSMYTCTYAIYT